LGEKTVFLHIYHLLSQFIRYFPMGILHTRKAIGSHPPAGNWIDEGSASWSGLPVTFIYSQLLLLYHRIPAYTSFIRMTGSRFRISFRIVRFTLFKLAPSAYNENGSEGKAGTNL
jgi:hypothetical protein